ncbi:MAG: hypothetical protein M1838_003454 [Thelocarpon superellum]|nr:MAG: hypothetical protein M1838_003454 [Thelocarpon superellum]
MAAAPPRDDLKWFGEGFDGFPKNLSEDSVEYSIFIVDTTCSGPELHAQLELIRVAAAELSEKLLRNYIWQRDAFRLDVQTEDGLTFLHGRTHYGDAIEDEWLVVYLLLELGKKFHRAWTRVVDSDGQFLLVEAAQALPRWLNPEVADNRVWLNNGRLMIISPPEQTAEKARDTPVSRNLSLAAALRALSENSSAITHSTFVEAEAFYRLRHYPAQISKNLHHARLTIPRLLAGILHEHPAFIALATDAFFLRDPIATRPLQNAAASGVQGLRFPPRDLVTVSAIFTKVGFAQVKSQHFSPPSIWADVLPADASPKESARAELGMRVTCAFEMLLADPQHREQPVVKTVHQMIDLIVQGDTSLPSDSLIATWAQGDDDESWLNVNFADFERTLSGQGAGAKEGKAAFRDGATEEDLRKMVERFEQFLNDDAAGAEGAEITDDMDMDDDDDDDLSSDASDDGEDKEVSFDEHEFGRLMREMMGMPAQDLASGPQAPVETRPPDASRARTASGDMEDESDESDGQDSLQEVMKQMAAELNEAGALNLDYRPTKIKTREKAPRGQPPSNGSRYNARTPEGNDDDDASEVDEPDEVEIDLNLAKNLLESFKSQAGMPGPGGNLLGLLGVQLPRDEEGDEPAEEGHPGTFPQD